MLDVVKKLLFARQIKFEKGKIFLLGYPIVMQPAEIFVQLKKEIVKKDPKDKFLYEMSKNAGKKYMKGISSKFKMSLSEKIKWGINSFELGGWGITEITDLKVKEFKAIIKIKNSTVAKLYGKSDVPVDDVMAGFIAGASCIYWNKEMDVIERKCIAKGDQFCEFIVLPTEEINKKRIVKK